MGAINNNEFKTERPDKSLYALKWTTKIKSEDGTDILEQEWIVTNFKMESELEENYKNKLRQRLAEKALYRKHGDLLYNIIYG